MDFTDKELQGAGLPEETVQVGCYSSLKLANEHALVVLSMGLAYWMYPDGDKYWLHVDVNSLDAVKEQLEKFDRENRFWPPPAIVYPPGEAVSLFGFIPYLSILIGAYILQHNGPLRMDMLGRMDVEAFVGRREWWRMITALTLHSDLAHLTGNLGMGCFFAFFVIQIFGWGIGWFAILCAGSLGNALNAWFHYPSEYYSIGASTSVFAAVGLIVGNALWDRLSRSYEPVLKSLFFPLFVAMVMLGWWGSAGARTDVTAHLFGLIAGVFIGILLALVRREFLRRVQYLCALAALLVIAVSWWAAYEGN